LESQSPQLLLPASDGQGRAKNHQLISRGRCDGNVGGDLVKTKPSDLLNLDHYPLDQHETSSFQELIARSQSDMAELGYVELPHFITEQATGALIDDAERLATRAFRSHGPGTAYLELPDETQWPEGHPRRRWQPYGVGAVSYDLIPLHSPLRALYESDLLLRFLEAVLNRGPLFRYADPFGALNLAVMGEGDELQWHFDQTDFVVSLAIQHADEGGNFDVVPKIRTTGDEHYDDVAAVLNGDHSKMVTLPMTPGTLLIFEGRNSIHRVSPLSGPTKRYVGLLGYDTKADTMSSDLLRTVRYGRTQAFATPPTDWPLT